MNLRAYTLLLAPESAATIDVASPIMLVAVPPDKPVSLLAAIISTPASDRVTPIIFDDVKRSSGRPKWAMTQVNTGAIVTITAVNPLD